MLKTFGINNLTINKLGCGILLATSGSTTWSLLTDGTTTIRKLIRDGYFVVDKTLTPLGFGVGSVEGVDWENVKGINVSAIIAFSSADVGTLPYTAADVLIRFNKNLETITVMPPDAIDFTVTFSGGAANITGLLMTGDEIIQLVLDRVIAEGETGTFTYTPGSNLIYSDDDGVNSVGALSGTITNNV